MKVFFFLFLFLFNSFFSLSYSGGLIGIGYGKTKAEAKKDALSDLASSVRVQVYSKYEQQTVIKDGNDISSDSSKFMRLISNVYFINPDVYYQEEKGKFKAIATAGDLNAYINKMSDLSDKINMLAGENANISKKQLYRQYEEALVLYNEYEGYELVLNASGAGSYIKPLISSAELKKRFLELQSKPPSLDIAAEILAKPMADKINIYVLPPLKAGSDKPTPFGLIFKDIISSKLKSNRNKDSADYNMECLYTPSDKSIIMSCSLISSRGAIISSSLAEIPDYLVQGADMLPDKESIKSISKNYNKTESDLKVMLKISTDGNSSILKAGESYTLLAKSNKPAFLYIANYTEATDGNTLKMLPLGKKKEILTEIKEKDRWISLGVFKVSDYPGTSKMHVFSVTENLNLNDIMPQYAITSPHLFNAPYEKAYEDFMYLFNRIKCDKYTNILTFSIIGNAK